MRRMPLPVPLVLVLPLAVVLAACGSSAHPAAAGASSQSASSSPTTAPTADASAVAGTIGGSVRGAFGTEPKITVPSGKAPTVVTYHDIKVGTGALATGQSNVTVNYEGVDYQGGKVFDASWTDQGPASFSLASGVIRGFALGIAGMRVGGEREIVIPSVDGYGATGSPPAIAPNENLIFVVELLHVASATEPSVAAVPGRIGGSVSTTMGKEPKVTAPTGPAPTVVTYRDVVRGTGAVAKANSSVTVQYVGFNYANGKIFDASWTDGHGAAAFSLAGSVLPGLQAGITGMRVGGRREIVIPSKYGDGTRGNTDITPNETLVFVVDLLKVS
jgi:peptidylprolyl isomerase